MVSPTRINSFNILHTHTQACRMHPSYISASFIHLILPFRAAGRHRISPQLPCSHIDFRSRLNYFGMMPITQVLRLAVFDHISLSPNPSLTHLPHTLLFILVCFVDMHVFIASIFDLFFFLVLWHAQCGCVSVCEEGREGELVHIMNNAWCGFLVSETDRRWGR